MSLTHIDSNNNPTMVDVSDKKLTIREASARSIVRLPGIIANEINDKGELNSKKVLSFKLLLLLEQWP